MIIGPDSVVSFHYRLSELDGEELENSNANEPMAYLHGHGNILPALEQAMVGREPGAKFAATLTPEQAYGVRRENSQQRVPVKHLMFKGKLRVGMSVKLNTEHGPRDVRIVKVGRFTADIDTNHPLAGMSLSFDIEIVDVRAASDEEIAHRHVHGAGGHHH